MSYNVKYQMNFKDSLSANYVLQLCFADYSGDIIPIGGAEKPAILTINGDEDNLFYTIHTSKLEINLFQPIYNEDLNNDIDKLTDRECYVKVDSDKGFTWRGWLIPAFSKRTFNKSKINQSLQAVDLFTYLKSAKATDPDDKIIYGKKSLIWLLENAFSKVLVDPFEYELTANMTFTNDAPELSGYNILEQIAVAAESFNDDSGRPPFCYDLIQKLLHGVGLSCYLKGEKVIITDWISVNRDVFKEIIIKRNGEKEEILIGDDEVITNVRGSKEISGDFKYNRTTGILPDGFFADWTGGELNSWLWNNNGILSQVGNGRTENPYGVLLETDATEIGGVNFEKYAGLRNSPYRGLLSGTSYTIDFSVKYQDWRSWGISNLPNPQLQFGMLLEGVSGKQYELWEENGYTKDQSLWVETTKDGSGNYVTDKDTFYSSWLHTRRSISLDSTTARQKLSYNIPAIPEDGVLYVYICSAFLSPTLSHLTTNLTRSDLIYYSVILSENLSVNANGVGGEKHYLTQIGDYALIGDTETFELETGLNESVAGSVYTNVAFHIPIPNIMAGTWDIGDQVNFMNYKSAPAFPYTYFSLIKLLMTNRMYYKRFPNNRIDLSFRSNTVQFGDLIKFTELGVNIVPSLYVQLNDKFDLKKATHETTVLELTGEFRFPGTETTTGSDSYEFYYQTND